MMNSTEIGNIGENSVCKYLVEKGYTIIARNYRIKGGEIDIIATNSDYIAFVEVKTRKPNSISSGFDSVNARKQHLIIKTASDYCSKYPVDLQPRFDIAEVIIINGNVQSIDYIKNAYDTTGYNY